jgi:hypothetical protein
MRALFAYLLALSVLLGAGYEGLRWLSQPEVAAVGEPISASTKPSAKGAVHSEKPEPHGLDAAAGAAEAMHGAPATHAGPADEVVAATPTSPTAAGPEAGDPQAPAKKTEDVTPGGCMPFGLTARGELVFPMQCQQLLAKHRGTEDDRTSPSAEAAPASIPPKGNQTAEIPKAAAEEKASTRPPEARSPETPEHDTNPQVRDNAVGAEPAKESPAADAIKPRKPDRENIHHAHARGVMMILRTIEYPDGYREQRLLPIGRGRRAALQTERE